MTYKRQDAAFKKKMRNRAIELGLSSKPTVANLNGAFYYWYGFRQLEYCADQAKARERFIQQLSGNRSIPSECSHDRKKIFNGHCWRCEECGAKI